MTREELLEPIVKSIRKGTSLPRQEIERFFSDWDAVPFQIDGEHAGVGVFKGTDVHFALVPGFKIKGSCRGAVRSLFKPYFDRQGFLTTRVPHERPAQKEFVKRVGFEPTWEDGNVTYFMLTRLPFERNA